MKIIPEEDIRVLNLITGDMDMELSIIVKEESMQDTGNKIKCMAKVSFIIQIRKWLMMGTGKMINCQAMEFFLMNRWLL